MSAKKPPHRPFLAARVRRDPFFFSPDPDCAPPIFVGGPGRVLGLPPNTLWMLGQPPSSGGAAASHRPKEDLFEAHAASRGGPQRWHTVPLFDQPCPPPIPPFVFWHGMRVVLLSWAEVFSFPA